VKVLLDEMLPIGVRQLLPEYQVMTAAYVGLAGVSNGEMISRAISDGFDVIVSLDRGIPHQQNLDRYAVGFVLIPHNDIERIRAYAEALSEAVATISPVRVVRIADQPMTGA